MKMRIQKYDWVGERDDMKYIFFKADKVRRDVQESRGLGDVYKCMCINIYIYIYIFIYIYIYFLYLPAVSPILGRSYWSCSCGGACVVMCAHTCIYLSLIHI